MSLDPLLVQKHEHYFKICLQSFPSKAQSEDSNKLALIYFCLHGLGLLNKLNFSEEENTKYSNLIYEHLIIDPGDEIQSFRSSQTSKLPTEENSFDFPNLSATFFALANLLILESDYSKRLDNHKIMKFVQSLQINSGNDKGSFKPVLDSNKEPFGESDLRFCYIAVCIRKLLKYDQLPNSERINDIDEDSLIAFILDRINFNGGLSSNKLTESHAGLTFCGIASLSLLNYKFSYADWVEMTKSWLVHRQVDYPKELYNEDYDYYDTDDIGGFNGRENKFSDTCYSWWATSSLHIIDPKGLHLVNLPRAAQYLLNFTQHKLIGGFSKDGEAFPDPFHSFLGLASLSLWKSSQKLNYQNEDMLENIDPTLVITATSKQFFLNNINFLN